MTMALERGDWEAREFETAAYCHAAIYVAPKSAYDIKTLGSHTSKRIRGFTAVYVKVLQVRL